MTKKNKFEPNTLDYDPEKPEHAHIREAIAKRMIAGEVKDHIKATTKKPSLKSRLLGGR